MKTPKLHRRVIAGWAGGVARDADATALASAENEGWRILPTRHPAAAKALADLCMQRSIQRVLELGLRPLGALAAP